MHGRLLQHQRSQRKASEWLRLAARIEAAYQRPPITPAPVVLPCSTWQACLKSTRQLTTARRLGWQHAATQLEQRLRLQLRQLRSELDPLCSPALLPEPPIYVATLGDIYQDLLALNAEFEQVSYNARGQTLSVTTEPIELEGVYLGPFEIRLSWQDLSAEAVPHYRILAVDPHPATNHDHVTHPHVQRKYLCEGDGRGPIRQALATGRLLDFFLIVAGILRTYNEGSPHVALADWGGIDCTDCGCRVSAEDRWICERCGAELCDDCRIECINCDDVCCQTCLNRCGACEESYCTHCLPPRRGDATTICPSCRDNTAKETTPHDHPPNDDSPNHDLPKVDLQTQETADDATPPAALPGTAAPPAAADGTPRAAIQSARLGQAPVSA